MEQSEGKRHGNKKNWPRGYEAIILCACQREREKERWGEGGNRKKMK